MRTLNQLPFLLFLPATFTTWRESIENEIRILIKHDPVLVDTAIVFGDSYQELNKQVLANQCMIHYQQ